MWAVSRRSLDIFFAHGSATLLCNIHSENIMFIDSEDSFEEPSDDRLLFIEEGDTMEDIDDCMEDIRFCRSPIEEEDMYSMDDWN